MNIYLACTVRGDRSAVAALRDLADALEAEGHTILTRHLLDENADSAEAALAERQVYERDIEWLEAADLLIADASGSSFGVCFEVGWVLANAEYTNRRVLLLYRADRKDRISRLIVGNAHKCCRVVSYVDAADLRRQVRAGIDQRDT
jgi:2'-deoxynucleoside 5'-phosphate N-hydrolase